MSSSETDALCATNLFTLPIEIRRAVYKQVLALPHPIYLFQGYGGKVESFGPQIPLRWRSLVYTNRQIHTEASEVLYGASQFMLMDTTPQQVNLLQAFMDRIGRVHSRSLTHLCINFPMATIVEEDPPSGQSVSTDMRSLQILQAHCTSLHTLEMQVHKKNSSVWTDPDKWPSAQQSLMQTARELRGMPSLNRIIIRFYNVKPTLPVMDLMQELGWVVLFGDSR